MGNSAFLTLLGKVHRIARLSWNIIMRNVLLATCSQLLAFPTHFLPSRRIIPVLSLSQDTASLPPYFFGKCPASTECTSVSLQVATHKIYSATFVRYCARRLEGRCLLWQLSTKAGNPMEHVWCDSKFSEPELQLPSSGRWSGTKSSIW